MPPELILLIASFSGKKVLDVLSRTNSFYRQEAQAVLFHTFRAHGTAWDVQRYLRFLLETPHIASKVRCAIVAIVRCEPDAGQRGFDTVRPKRVPPHHRAIASLIAQAIHSSLNLESLELDITEFDEDDCKELEDRLMKANKLGISHLRLAHLNENTYLDEDANMNDDWTGATSLIRHCGPLESLQIFSGHKSEAFRAAREYQPNLKRLSLHEVWDMPDKLLNAISPPSLPYVAHHFKSLEWLVLGGGIGEYDRHPDPDSGSTTWQDFEDAYAMFVQCLIGLIHLQRIAVTLPDYLLTPSVARENNDRSVISRREKERWCETMVARIGRDVYHLQEVYVCGTSRVYQGKRDSNGTICVRELEDNPELFPKSLIV